MDRDTVGVVHVPVQDEEEEAVQDGRQVRVDVVVRVWL